MTPPRDRQRLSAGGRSFITRFNGAFVLCRPGGSAAKPYLPWERHVTKARDHALRWPSSTGCAALSSRQNQPCLFPLSLSFLSWPPTDRIPVNMQEERKRAATNTLRDPVKEKTAKVRQHTEERELICWYAHASFYEIVNEKTTPEKTREEPRARDISVF